MAKPIFTPDQLSAIMTRDKSLLVSAAAGSGKTATLTERIIRSLTDKKNPEDISRMLIVTFTNAAVADLKEKITGALREAIAENPFDERLLHQLYALPSAHISTIDSFCNEILKSNCEKFGISPKYRIADPIEADLLAHSVWSLLIDAAYNGDIEGISPEEFEELTVSLAGVKNNSSLEEAFSFLYDKAKDHEQGVEIFEYFAEAFAKTGTLPVEENVYGKYAIKKTKEFAEHYRSVILDFMTRICGSASNIDGAIEKSRLLSERRSEADLLRGKAKKEFLESLPEQTSDDKYLLIMQSDLEILDKILAAESYSDMRSAVDVSFDKMPSVSDKTELQEDYATVRDKIKDIIKKKHRERYYSYSVEEWHCHLSDMQKLTSTLACFIKEFDRVYFNEKKSRSMLEYSDIERLTYLALYDEAGEPSELALSLREEYTSVYIDEYQDVNLLQNKIFLAISNKNNRFTVGDIKQSIYVFRNARPEIFAEMKNSFPPLSEASASDTASIFMSENFRCDEGIIDFANDVFDEMFTLAKESIGYVESDKLKFAKKYGGDIPPYRVPEIHLFAGSEKDEDEDEDEILPSERSAKWIAEKINSLLTDGKLNSGEPVKPSDIAIILRKDQGRTEIYKREIEKLGIPVRAPQSRDFFLNSEIQLVLCLLNSINNPRRDIYLAGLMLSPIFDFTPDELYFARRLGGATLYQSVKMFSEENPENTKFSSFINTLDRYRKISEGMQVDTLIMRLYNETGLLALAKNGGSRENLMLLYSYAKKFEESSFKGLYNFINYVNGIIDSGKTFSLNKEGDTEDSVTIITAHKSKGLEFPIVFLADASVALISANERKARIAYSEALGLGIKKRISGGLALVESPVRNVIIDSNIEKSLEEELRVYYVAVTRARESLYIVGSPRAKTKLDYIAKNKIKKIHKSAYSLKEMTSFVDILCFVDTKSDIVWHEEVSENKTDFKNEIIEDTHLSDAPYDDEVYRNTLSRLTFKYRHKHLTALPEKMSISRLYPTVLDGLDTEDSSDIVKIPQNSAKLGKVPLFISGTDEDASAKRGIATHTFLQFFDLGRLETLGVEGELKALIEKGFIAKADAERVRIDELRRFASSKLFYDMKSAKKLYREFRFNVMLPASMFTASDEKKKALSSETILLQGVIDCIIIDENDNLHLVDYKTDRLTPDELSDKTLAKKSLSERHSLQLSYYKKAVERIFGKSPTATSIYSLPLGDTVEIDTSEF